MLAAIDVYSVSVFVHVAAVVVGFGATYAEAIAFPVAMKVDKRHLPFVHRLGMAINQWLATPALVVVLATGGPGSMIGFDYARTFNPSSRQGAAVGIVNVGGFVASLLVAWGVGLVLGAAGGYTPGAFRLAWTVQYAIWAFAVVAVLVARRRARSKLAAEGTTVPPLREALAARRRSSRSKP
jgi:hypothetical protein